MHVDRTLYARPRLFWARFAAVGLALTIGCGDDPEPEVVLGFELRTLSVPVDEDASSAAIDLRYLWSNETGRDDPPVLVFLFGGPGSSSVELLAFVSTFLPDWMTAQYALVALDEAGVGGSVPIQCPALGSSDDPAFPHPFIASSSTALDAIWSESAPDCRSDYPYQALIGTERHARDIERLRRALGVETLDIMAYSYGTRVALTYAALFPGTTGRLVLDSPVDPRQSYIDQLREQALARQASLTRFLDWCDGPGACSFSRETFAASFVQLEETPVSYGLEYLTLLDGLIFEPQWPAVADELSDVLVSVSNSPRLVQSNRTVVSPPAFIGTLCADSVPITVAQIEAEKTALAATTEDAVLPVSYFADVFNGAYACPYWPPYTPDITWTQALADVDARTEVLLVNASGDYKSPASFAESLATAMPSMARVRIDEVSHAVGLQGVNACVDAAIRAFLIDGNTEAPVVDCAKSTLIP